MRPEVSRLTACTLIRLAWPLRKQAIKKVCEEESRDKFNLQKFYEVSFNRKSDQIFNKGPLGSNEKYQNSYPRTGMS